MSLRQGHRLLWWLALILWLSTLALGVYQGYHHTLPIPIIAYNQPHGVVGWLGATAVIVSMASGLLKWLLRMRASQR
ncbi:hypothetical protein [Lactiplantibacillus mudanjiangensis]|uniref:Uncharacterized protein n=1 Tax=Lactiplantibacillus mudanjiangensis TaxID=1296538 RepID=A0A660E229_9LACO|nr:hypothetical protein [Lactiplantibacillus mudanjiangensis]VDG19713.1 hypothetical protein [Lactobacillus acidophilus NCFM] [Lactiplantibacillus mudanjiangensis]VDG24389.1 hypothetical protein [Lactobacillus acidophilus NCFM] [Lactiplantibacillus mudanjiangensis]VDG28191.1 hypothetical protein [Lactobacillus acidophilus NCFM] [Lactiplantibacillus mudanjiangensis]VDG31147.1 hypothetical protein [Lactobacillus acidophilus NCFM] [Lactiplantibacillus mudanjiangensis]